MEELFRAAQSFIDQKKFKEALALLVEVPEILGRYCYSDVGVEMHEHHECCVENFYKRWVNEALEFSFAFPDLIFLGFDLLLSLKHSLTEFNSENRWSWGDYEFSIKKSRGGVEINQAHGINLKFLKVDKNFIKCKQLLDLMKISYEHCIRNLEQGWAVTKPKVRFKDIELELSHRLKGENVPRVVVGGVNCNEKFVFENGQYHKVK